MLKSRSRAMVLVGPGAAVLWLEPFFQAQPGCSARWQACSCTGKGLENGDVSYLWEREQMLSVVPYDKLQLWVETLQWNIQDQTQGKQARLSAAQLLKSGLLDLCYAFYIFPWQQPPTMILPCLFTSISPICYSQYLSFCLIFPVPIPQYGQHPLSIYSNLPVSTTSLLPDPSLISRATM